MKNLPSVNRNFPASPTGRTSIVAGQRHFFAFFAEHFLPTTLMVSAPTDMVVQCPIWFQKPQCLNCEDSLDCFIRRLNSKFLKFEKGEGKMFHIQDHFCPWSWLCSSSQQLNITFVKYQKNMELYSALEKLLRQDHVVETTVKWVQNANQKSHKRVVMGTWQISGRMN